MTPHPDPMHPPPLAVWLVSAFAPGPAAEPILGDLHEEFSRLATTAGVASARNWYWRQTAKTVAHLAVAGLRNAPWTTAAVVVGGLFLMRIGSRLPAMAVAAALHACGMYEHHPALYSFCLQSGVDLGIVLVAMLVGALVALAARGRELIATTALALILGAMAVAAFSLMVVRTGDYSILYRLPWHFADSLALVSAGALLRTRRTSPPTQPS